ncbi:MAG: winged helix DNA-binding protein [Paracoccus sp. (in: a-proteobacteria)]|nr:winged helix DNA-binding protein [Paracoccus sp. (in: a-proteobacteria)]
MAALDDDVEMSARVQVVSAAHLAQSGLPELSEVEFALTMCNHAFQRWMTRCMVAAGGPAMSPLEVQILHLVHHRGRAKTLADLCLMMNIEDTHLASYALRKLTGHGLIVAGRAGKEKTVATTARGAELCAAYAKAREALLIEPVLGQGFSPDELSRLAALMRTLSGSYDQAARVAASL